MRLIFYFFTLFLFCSCAQAQNINKPSAITGISYKVHLPIVELDGQVSYVGDSTPIYFYKNYILYQLPYIFDTASYEYHVSSDTYDTTFSKTQIKYKYLIYEKDSLFGILYNSSNGIEFKKILIDSIVANKKAPSNIHSIMLNSKFILAKKFTGENKSENYESYVLKVKENALDYDSVNFYYSKDLSNFAFSLSPTLDSIYHSKLTKFKIIYNEDYSSEHSMKLPKREFSFEISKISKIPEEIGSLFIKFEDDNN